MSEYVSEQDTTHFQNYDILLLPKSHKASGLCAWVLTYWSLGGLDGILEKLFSSLVLLGNMQLLESMLTKLCVAIWCH